MPTSNPSPEEAAGALAEAAGRARNLRGTDRRFRLVLLLVASVYVALGVLVGFARVLPLGAGLGVIALVVLASGLAISLVLLVGVRAISRPGWAWYWGSLAAFGLWNVIVVSVSLASGWWARGQPDFHVTVSAVVAALPLLAGAAGMRRGRR